MNAAETRASSAIADWTPLTVVPRSPTTAEIETFISEVSTTSTNIAIARTNASRVPPPASWPALTPGAPSCCGSPLQLDLDLALLAAHLDLNLEVQLVGQRNR